MLNRSVRRHLFNVYGRRLWCQRFVTVRKFSTMRKSSGQGTFCFFIFFLEHDKPCFFCFFCLINFKTEKQREGGVGMSVYSCSIVIVGKMQWDKCYKTVGKKYQL